VIRRIARLAAGTVAALTFVGVGILPASATRTMLAHATRTVAVGPGCASFPDLLTFEHTEVTRREHTLEALVALVKARHDPFAINATQIASVQAARESVATLDAQIRAGCYRTRYPLTADIAKIFADRVYWLRVPQTQIVAAADYLADAAARLSDAATKLDASSAGNTAVHAEVAAMRAALATAAQHLGTAPSISAAIAAVPGLQPARDMARNVTAMDAARTELIAAQAALATARAAGARAIAALQA